MKVSLIVATAQNHVIGNKGRIPWYLPDDLREFKRLTQTHHVVMGRKTYESIGRPLPNRVNLVLSNDSSWEAPEGVVRVRSLKQALAYAEMAGETEAFVIGGYQAYKEALPLADTIYQTQVFGYFEGDTFFPTLPPCWRVVSSDFRSSDAKNSLSFSFRKLERISLEEARLKCEEIVKRLQESIPGFPSPSYFSTHESAKAEWVIGSWAFDLEVFHNGFVECWGDDAFIPDPLTEIELQFSSEVSVQEIQEGVLRKILKRDREDSLLKEFQGEFVDRWKSVGNIRALCSYVQRKHPEVRWTVDLPQNSSGKWYLDFPGGVVAEGNATSNFGVSLIRETNEEFGTAPEWHLKTAEEAAQKVSELLSCSPHPD